MRAQARNRQELERAVAANLFDAVICADDLSGPLGGVAALRALQDDRRVHPDTAFILLVENARRDHLLACTRARPDAILLKPFSLALLSQRLKTAVHTRRSLSKLRELEEQGRWEDLLSESRRLASPQGGNYRLADQSLAKALCHLGRQNEAEAIFVEALTRTPGILWAEEAMARCEVAKGDLLSAEARLRSLVKSHPGHVDAHEMLYAILLDKGNLLESQVHLAHLAQFSGEPNRRRELGQLATLNNDLQTAISAFAGLIELDGNERLFEDQVNLVRVLLLNGDVMGAAHAQAHFRQRGRKDPLLPAVDYFITGARSRNSGLLGQSQASMVEGMRLIDDVPQAPHELLLMAVEACLMAVLTFQAAERSRKLLMHFERPLPPLQAQWVMKLHDWARLHPEEDDLPRGLRGYRRFLT